MGFRRKGKSGPKVDALSEVMTQWRGMAAVGVNGNPLFGPHPCRKKELGHAVGQAVHLAIRIGTPVADGQGSIGVLRGPALQDGLD